VSTTTPFLLKTADNPDGVDAAIFESVRRDQLMRDFPTWIEDNLQPFATPQTSPQMLEWVRGMALQASLQALVQMNRALTTEDFRAELAGISVPALVIHGDNDVSSPFDLTGRATSDLIPGAQLKIYEGAPHGLFVTHIERLTSDLLDFVHERAPGASFPLGVG